jgi:hypothetical protein
MCIEQIIIPFLPNLCATLIGVALGFILARWYNERRIEKTRKEREQALLKCIKATLIEASENIQQNIVKMPNNIWLSKPDITLLESIASIKYEIIKDLELNGKVDRILFKLGNLSNLVWMLRQAMTAPQHVGSPSYISMQSIQTIIKSMCEGEIQPLIEDVLKKIEKILK